MKTQWYLIRTKAGEERRAQEQLNRISKDVLRPLIKTRVRRSGRLVESVSPLFPCYLFALLDLAHEWGNVRYTRGVRELVCFGGEPAVVPEPIVHELKERCAIGPLELPTRQLSPGERVRVVDGPLRELEGVFERYLSGPERVAILLSVVGGARILLSARMVAAVA